MLGLALNSLVTSASSSFGVEAKMNVRLLMIVSVICELDGRVRSDDVVLVFCVCCIEKVK